MAKLKLIYFNYEGRAELIRWCFAYGGISYVDERVETSSWPERKKNIPGGKLPILMVDDAPLRESIAIARYAAKQAGLIPEDDYQAAQCDSLSDRISGLMNEVVGKVIFSQAEPAEKLRIYIEELIPNLIIPFLDETNERFESTKWFISGKPTWVDLLLCLSIMKLTALSPDLLKNYPNVSKLIERVKALPAIKNWIKLRPHSLSDDEWMKAMMKLVK